MPDTYRAVPAGSNKWRVVDGLGKPVSRIFTTEAGAKEWLKLAQPTKGAA